MLLWISVVTFIVLALIAVVLLVSGYDMGTIFLSVVLMLIGNAFIIVAAERHNKVVNLQNELVHYDDVKTALADGVQKWTGFENAYQKIVLDQQVQQQQRLRTLEQEWAARIAEATEHSQAVKTVAAKYVKDLVGWVMKNVSPNNYATSKDKIAKAIEFCRKKGAIITAQDEQEINDDLKTKYVEAVRKQAAKEEQDRIREKIREEQKAQAEIDRELRRLENERAAIEAAIQKALARTQDEHSAEVEELRRKLTEAEARSQRAMSMAQQTKAGNVYVISNIGSFGQDVFKIGMTRRLEPLDRVKELGDASVPFSFDVHMMISCDDAPGLENALHKKLHHKRLNKVNHRKEFFRVTLDEVRQIVEANHGRVDYVVDPEALEYFESQKLGDADLEFVENVLDQFDDDDE
jgi:chemotaxis protein histidine kinase CheA